LKERSRFVFFSFSKGDRITCENDSAMPLLQPIRLACPGGARHRVVAGYSLGPDVDADANCQPDDNADGTVDEMGDKIPWKTIARNFSRDEVLDGLASCQP
jgi:hypothetical protein